LRTFIPSAQLTPGRLNVFKFKNFKVLIDFAHNPAGYEAIEDYLKNVESTKKIGIISGVGDRRDEDIKLCGKIAGRMFDYIIIRNEKHLRGRTEDEINGLIIEGIQQSGRDVSYEIIPKEIEALKHAMSMAEEGTFKNLARDRRWPPNLFSKYDYSSAKKALELPIHIASFLLKSTFTIAAFVILPRFSSRTGRSSFSLQIYNKRISAFENSPLMSSKIGS